MLSDNLKAIAMESSRGQCRMHAVLTELPADDARALIGALQNSAISQRKICKALQDEGIRVSRDAVTHARACLSKPDICRCNVARFGEQ